jgi:putative transposase
MDFVSDAFATSRRFRVLTIKDLFTHELICLHVDRSIPGCAVARALDRVIAERGQWPDGIICDNGTELTSKAMDMWEHRTGAKLQFIEPGKPIQNAFIESFNGKFPRECLDQHWFSDLSQARQIIEAWRIETNPMRPTKPLGQLTPSEFAKKYQDEVRARTTT